MGSWQRGASFDPPHPPRPSRTPPCAPARAHVQEARELRLQQLLQLLLAQLVLVALFARVGVEHIDESLHRRLQLRAHRAAHLPTSRHGSELGTMLRVPGVGVGSHSSKSHEIGSPPQFILPEILHKQNF